MDLSNSFAPFETVSLRPNQVGDFEGTIILVVDLLTFPGGADVLS